MRVERQFKPAFAVIGREGSTRDGDGFIKRLWDDANARFGDVAPLAKKDESGRLVGIWGAMSDFTRALMPWENGFSEGLYLAGVECDPDAQPPEGWVKWIVPAHEYVVVAGESGEAFATGIAYLRDNGLALAGAANDFIHPQTGESAVYLPVAERR